MFSNLTGSGWVIVTRISAGKSRRINRRDCNRIVVGIEQIQCFPERIAEVQDFYPAEEFLKRREMRYDRKIQFRLDRLHVADIFNEFSIVLVPVIFEKNQDEKLILSVDLLRIFTGIRTNSYCFHDRNCGSDKPDIPARQSFNRLLPFWRHIKGRRQCTLDLSVNGNVCFW